MNDGIQYFEGELSAEGLRFAVVVSRFNSFITDRLLAGALDAIGAAAGSDQAIEMMHIPGAWEFPVDGSRHGAGEAHDAIICLGAVIRGDTPHFDYVAGEAARRHCRGIGRDRDYRWHSAC